MKKVSLALIAILMIVISGCSSVGTTSSQIHPETGAKAEGYDVNEFSSSSSDNAAISDSALIARTQLYMQTRFSTFKDCTFEDGTIVQKLENGEYLIAGEMKDQNKVKHEIYQMLQIFPNETEYLVCLLKVDGQKLVVNQPKHNSEVPNSNPSTGINVSLGLYGETDVSAGETVSYILTISDTENLPLSGVTMRIECNSQNVVVKNNSDIENPIVKKGNSSFTWDLSDKINSNQSTVKNIYLSSNVPGNYSVKLYFLTSNGSKVFTDVAGAPMEKEADFSVLGTNKDDVKAREKALTDSIPGLYR